MQNVATVLQSYNGREWLPERGIVHLNASPECIISFPWTDQNSSLLHVGKLHWDFISFDMAEHELEWVGLFEMRRLQRLSITGIYARIGLGLRLSRACTNKSDWLIVPIIERGSDCGSRNRRFDSGPATYRLLKLIMRIFSLIEKGSCQMFNLSAQE